MKLLRSAGKAYLKSPEKLKYLICPIIAKSTTEQEQFYDLFDRYWKEISKPIEAPEADRIEGTYLSTIFGKLPKWIWMLPILVFLGTLAALVYREIQKNAIPKPIVHAAFPDGVQIGDTVKCLNLSEHHDKVHTQFFWQLKHPVTKEIVLEDSTSYDWSFILADIDEHHTREIHLISHHRTDELRDTFMATFNVLCQNPPNAEIQIKTQEIRAGEIFELQAKSEDKGLSYLWDFGDGTTSKGDTASHVFQNSGNFKVRLQVTRENAKGECFNIIEENINIGDNKAYLVFKDLQRDEMKPIAQFALGTWLLMGILSIGIIYFWVKWGTRQAPKPKENENQKNKSKAPDRGPYFIPFRNRSGYIKIEQQLFRFADVLRQRQEGIRKQVDVQGTIRATIASGGFPKLQLATNTTPTEYLFLIDEQSSHSHQSKLFEYLISFLGEKDVLIETYYYNTEFHRFWNRQHPKGIHPDMLRRLYPNHRLVIMGDAHAMLDPFANDKHALKPSAKALFKQWKYRLLLTSLPESSWTYREDVLHDHFSVFPSDLEGLTAATKHLESGREEEDMVSFKAWRAQVSSNYSDPDVNYRRWRSLEEHSDYLKAHPKVFKWLCALAVYPKPNWDVTIAIGYALKDYGVEVTYDNLLLLARIPWLQSGILSPKLRSQFLEALSPEIKNAAHQAVATELAEVEDLVQNSFANRQWETEQAIQKYAIDPRDIGNQKLVRDLYKKGWFSKKQQADLKNTYYNQPRTDAPAISQKSIPFDKIAPQIPAFEDFIVKEAAADKKARPFFTSHFYWAMITSLIYLFLFIFIWKMGATDELYRMVFNKEPAPVYETKQLKNYFFVKEEVFADSAVILNNNAVDIWNTYAGTRYPVSTPYRPPDLPVFESSTDFENKRILFRSAQRQFEQSYELSNETYELSRLNLARMQYNLGVVLYHMVLADSADHATLNSARTEFNLAMEHDSLLQDARHGVGLSHFYDSGDDTLNLINARSYLNLLDATTFFDTLSLFPNLKSLMTEASEENTIRISGKIVNASTGLGIDNVNVRINGDNFIENVSTNQEGVYFFDLPESQQNSSIAVRATKSGYSSQNFGTSFNLNNRLNLSPIKLISTRSTGLPSFIRSQLLTNVITRPALDGNPNNRMGDIKGIVIHYHDKQENSDNKTLRDYYNQSTNGPSVHYLVDANEVLQVIPDEEVANHIAITNPTQRGQVPTTGSLKNQMIGIEVCEYKGAEFSKIQDNLTQVCRYLMQKYALSIDQVYRHSDLDNFNDDCPEMFANSESWEAFRAAVDTSFAYTLSIDGFVKDSASGIVLADVQISSEFGSVTTNPKGYFKLNLPLTRAINIELELSKKGFNHKSLDLRIQQDEPLEILLGKEQNPEDGFGKTLEENIKPNLFVIAIGPVYPNIQFTSKDADDFAEILQIQKGLGFYNEISINLLNGKNNTNRAQIISALEDLQKDYFKGIIKESDYIFLFISGLGIVDENNEYYIATTDYDKVRLPQSSINVKQEIISPFSKLNCKIIFFNDACYSGAISSDNEVPQLNYKIEGKTLPQNMIVFTSSKESEKTYENVLWQNSAFTQALLEAFGGEAPFLNYLQAGQPKTINTVTLGNYLQFRVPVLTQSVIRQTQTPQLLFSTSSSKIEDLILFIVPLNEQGK